MQKAFENPVLSAHGLSHAWGQKRGAVCLFAGLDLVVQPGDNIAILGPSGCGKSTLLRILSGLLSPDFGQVRITDNLRVGFVFQEHRLLSWKTAKENILLPLTLRPQHMYPRTPLDIEALLKTCHLSPQMLNLYPHQLSGGMKMRTSLARALVDRPQVLFLDEPLSALDELSRAEIQTELQELLCQSKLTSVLVTHALPEALMLAQKILILGRNGQLRGEFCSRLPLLDRGIRRPESLDFFHETNRLQAFYKELLC